MELQRLIGKVYDESINTALMGSIGYLSVWAVTNINPMIGAVFGASYYVAGLAVDPVFSPNAHPEALIGLAIKTAISATFVFKILGTALSLKTTVIVGVCVGILGPVAYDVTVTILSSVASRLSNIRNSRFMRSYKKL